MNGYTQKLHPGSPFPALKVKHYGGDELELGKPLDNADWQMVVVYRGKHCPMCTKYLNALPEFTEKLNNIGISIVAVSADSESQLKEHLAEVEVNFPLAYGLTTSQMEQLGLYISNPRSPQETDHAFAEPGLFVVNEKGHLQVVDISNNPFVRPDIKTLVNGLAWIRNPDNNYPIRGTHL